MKCDRYAKMLSLNLIIINKHKISFQNLCCLNILTETNIQVQFLYLYLINSQFIHYIQFWKISLKLVLGSLR